MHASTSSGAAANKVVLALSRMLPERCIPRLIGQSSSYYTMLERCTWTGEESSLIRMTIGYGVHVFFGVGAGDQSIML